jgi:hypothetical protein
MRRAARRAGRGRLLARTRRSVLAAHRALSRLPRPPSVSHALPASSRPTRPLPAHHVVRVSFLPTSQRTVPLALRAHRMWTVCLVVLASNARTAPLRAPDLQAHASLVRTVLRTLTLIRPLPVPHAILGLPRRRRARVPVWLAQPAHPTWMATLPRAALCALPEILCPKAPLVPAPSLCALMARQITMQLQALPASLAQPARPHLAAEPGHARSAHLVQPIWTLSLPRPVPNACQAPSLLAIPLCAHYASPALRIWIRILPPLASLARSDSTSHSLSRQAAWQWTFALSRFRTSFRPRLCRAIAFAAM